MTTVTHIADSDSRLTDTRTPSAHSHAQSDVTNLTTDLSGKQATLVSGTNIKTVNGNTLLGSGDVSISSAVAWGGVTGTLSAQTDLQTALDGKVDENVAITGATKTKVTYDTKGLITAGADATTADIADSSNKRYVTDAQLTVIGNTSGTNTGDQTSIAGITGTIAQFNTACSDADFATGGGTATGTNTGDNAVNSNYSGLVSNATHTGDATGATALTVVKIQGKDFPTLAAGDDQKYPKYVSASNAFVMTAIAGGGDMVLADVQTVTGAKTFGSAGAVGKLKLAGNTSGTITLDAPAVAGTTTVTVPAQTGTLLIDTSTAGVGTTPTASGTVAVTHGLGRTPTIIRISAKSGFTSNASATPTTSSEGIWCSSGNRCIYQGVNGTTTIAAATSATFAIFMDTSVGNNISGVIQNVGATTFDIAFTETGTHTRGVYMWEAQ